VLLVFALGCSGIFGDPEDVTVKVDAPLRVVEGQDFPVVVTVTNTAGRAQTLNSLDVADAYIAGIAITSSTPPFTDSMHVPIDNTWSYEYMLDIPAGGEVQVTLNASALKVGDFNGDIGACINSDSNFLSMPVRTVVSKAGAEQQGP